MRMTTRHPWLALATGPLEFAAQAGVAYSECGFQTGDISMDRRDFVEGGYNLDGTALAAAAHVETLPG